MKSSQYLIAKSDRYTLIKKVGTRNIALVSDENGIRIELIHQKICAGLYATEYELFEDIFKQYSDKSIIPLFRE